MQKEYKRLSRRSKVLMSQAEGLEVDFKRNALGVKQKTLVAFANSRRGGALLVGVEEYATEDGLQRGRVVGCEVTDHVRLQIQNKAISCIPPVNIQIFTENTAHCPILRIEIPSGLQKPYCSQSGEYTIRADGRNRPLLPEELLNIFMDQESEQFLQRFKHAVGKLETQVTSMDEELRSGVNQMLGDMNRLDRDTSHILTELYGRSQEMGMENHASQQHGAEIDRKLIKLKHSVDKKSKALSRRMGDVHVKLDALLEHFTIEDPLRRRARDQIHEMASMIGDKQNSDLVADFMDVLIHIYPDIEAQTLEQWVNDAIEKKRSE